MNKNININEIERKKILAIQDYIKKLKKLEENRVINEETRKNIIKSYQKLINIKVKKSSGNTSIDSKVYNELVKKTNLSRFANVKPDGRIKFKNIESLSDPVKAIRVGNRTHAIDEVYDYVKNDSFVSDNHARSFIIGYSHNLHPKFQKNICLLILNKMTKQYFTEYVNLKENSSDTTNVIKKATFLMEVLKKLGPQHFDTLVYLRDLLNSYTNTFKNTKNKEKYMSLIDEYISDMKNEYSKINGGKTVNVFNNKSRVESALRMNKNV